MATLNFPDDPSSGDKYTDSNSGFSYEWDGTVWKSSDPSTASNIEEIDDISGDFDGSETDFTLKVAAVSDCAGLVLVGHSSARVDATIGNGAASLTTIAGDLDIDGDTITSAGALEIDPGGALSITGQHVNIDATKALYLDGGGDTYIYEQGADVLRVVVGGDVIIHISELGDDGNVVSF